MKIINSLPDTIDRLLEIKDVDEFTFSLVKVNGGPRNDFTIKFRFGYYVPNGTARSDEEEAYIILRFSGVYAIFYELNNLTFSEQHLGITEDDDEESRVNKRIIALVWKLYKYLDNEFEKPDSRIVNEVTNAPRKTGYFTGDFRSAESPLGSIRFERAE